MPAGRPTKCTPELMAKAQDYADNWKTVGDDEVYPSIAGLACYLGIRRETIHHWHRSDDKEEFSHIVDQILHSQERVLTNGSLRGDLNPTISKLLLTKHNYSERVENTHSGPDGKPIEVDQQWTVEVVERD